MKVQQRVGKQKHCCKEWGAHNTSSIAGMSAGEQLTHAAKTPCTNLCEHQRRKWLYHSANPVAAAASAASAGEK